MSYTRKTECFKIRLLSFDKERDIFDIDKGKQIIDLPCLERYAELKPVFIMADPFLFVHNDRLFLFYEKQRMYKPGVLDMISTTDLKTWTEPVTVLQEPFHLSFPWVFREGGLIYMIPETNEDGSVRLYRADNDSLTSFSLVKRLITHPANRVVRWSYVDSNIVKKEGTFYLFTMVRYEDGLHTLELYTSDRLEGPYAEHPASPVVRSQKIGRNAGSIFETGGRLIRPAQDCTKRYGDNVHLNEITTLTPTTYGERLIREHIIPTSLPFYKEGGHQWNAVRFRDKWIVATDAKEYHWLFVQRSWHKLEKLFR